MKTILSVCAVLLLASCMAACSVYMEATRPSAVDLNDFRQGIYRDAVVKRLGPPDSTAVESDGTNCDHYELYTGGYSSKGKVTIASLEGTVDLLTIGLAEVILTPTEALTKNKKYPVAFCYRGEVLARVTAESKPDADKHQSPPDNASPNQTGDQPVATPAASRVVAAVDISAPSTTDAVVPPALASPSAGAAIASDQSETVSKPVADQTSNPQVGDQWQPSDDPQ